ncbi:hypothetical protein FRC07_008857 [Ceratobasidium sp. 392]|nr:hypothetical protein FRC07_008857 [Ceratobasidium sp. 392]
MGVKRTRTMMSGIKRSITNSSSRATGVTGRITEAMMSLVNRLRTLVRRPTSALSVATEEGNESNHWDEELRGGTIQTDLPATYMFSTESGSGNLGANKTLGGRKLPDIGKGAEDTIYEDRPLVVNVLAAPTATASPPSAGGSPRLLDDESTTETPVQSTEAAGPVAPRNAKFREVTKRAVAALKLQQVHVGEPVRSMSSPSVMSESRYWRDSSEHQLNLARTQSLVSMLRTLQYSQILTEHVALVKHLQFSPDGQFLATCSWDKTALIWKVGSGPNADFEVQHKLVHTSRIGGFVGQVAWSPTGDQLLTKQLKFIKVWDAKIGVCARTIDRKRNVQSITWLPKGSGFLSVEWQMVTNRWQNTVNIIGSDLVILRADGAVKDVHHLERLQVWDAVVTPDEQRIVAVATLVSSAAHLKPVKSRSEKRILIYNLFAKEIEK